MQIQTTAITPLPWDKSSTESEYSASDDDNNPSSVPIINTPVLDLELNHHANQDPMSNCPMPHNIAYHQFNLSGWINTPHQPETNHTPPQPHITPLNPEPPRQRNHFQPTLDSSTITFFSQRVLTLPVSQNNIF